MRVLITGVTGMVGSHLAEYLLAEQKAEVYGLYRWRSRMENLEELQHQGHLHPLGIKGSWEATQGSSPFLGEPHPSKLNLVEGDLTDPHSMHRNVAAIRPEGVFHLAAQSYVPTSWRLPAETLHINVIGQVHLFEALRAANINPRVHIAGSSEEYGEVLPEELPLKESNPLRPLSPYAVSKIAQEMLAFQYWKSYGLQTVVTRGFNHTGPRRGEVFVTSSLAKQIAEIEKGLRPPVLLVGDLSSQRDWTDVRDFVRAYWLALEKGKPGEVYNVGSGIARSVGEVVETLLSLTTARIEVKQDPARLRPSDVKLLLADATKFRRLTGWEPQIPFAQTMRDLLDYWRRRV